MNLIYPADFVDKDHVDIRYQQEAVAFARAGFSVYTYSEDTGDVTLISKGFLDSGETYYRGFSINYQSYLQMERRLRDSDLALTISSKVYVGSQWINGWYPNLKEFTFQTVLLSKKKLAEDLTGCLNQVPWYEGSFYVREFERDCRAPFSSSEDDFIVSGKESAKKLLASISGKISGLRGGLAFRKTLEINQHEARKFLIYRGQIKELGEEVEVGVPSVVAEVVKRHNSPLYVIETIKTVDGKTILLQIGDGQVLDYSPLSYIDYVDVLKRLVLRYKSRKGKE